jgi:hypothetical protein
MRHSVFVVFLKWAFYTFIALCCGLSLCVLLWRNGRGIVLSDEYFYAKNAFHLASTGRLYAEHTLFDSRWGLIVPTAFFVSILGSDHITFYCWTLLCFLASIWAVKRIFAVSNPPLALWTSLLLATNAAFLSSAVNISPDLVCICFLILCLGLVWRAEQYPRADTAWRGGWAAAVLAVAFLAKETALFFLPFLAYQALKRLKSRTNGTILHQRRIVTTYVIPVFWTGFTLTGLVLSVAYLFTCKALTGSFWYRWEVIDAQYMLQANDPYSLVGKPWSNKLYRAFLLPLPFFLKEPGYALWVINSLVAALCWWQWRPKVPELRFWGGAALTVGAMTVFSSVSLREYAPVTLADRMCLPFLPAWVIVTCAVLLRCWGERSQVSLRLRYQINAVLLLIASMAFGTAFWRPNTYIFVYFTGGYALALLILNNFAPRFFISSLLPLTLTLQLAYQFLISPDYGFAREQKVLGGIDLRKKTLVLTDSKLARMPLAHFAFHKPPNLHFAHWDTVQRMDLRAFEQKYLLYNLKRMTDPRVNPSATPDFVKNPRGKLIFKSEDVFFYDISAFLPQGHN